MSLDPELLFSALLSAGIKGIAGVPCSILNHLILEAEASDDVDYVAASVEGEAVSAAAGMWLAGGLGAALMQNSGLGNAVNPLASLSIPYEIPVLMIVSWRGEPGKKDAVHHYPMGEATPGLFELLGVPTTVIREDTDLDQVVREAVEFMKKERKPAALIVPRGVFSKGAGGGERPAPILSGKRGGRSLQCLSWAENYLHARKSWRPGWVAFPRSWLSRRRGSCRERWLRSRKWIDTFRCRVRWALLLRLHWVFVAFSRTARYMSWMGTAL